MRSVSRRGRKFEESIASLVSEIELAVNWQRASILVAVYRSVAVLADAEDILEQRLANLGLSLYRLKIDEQSYRVPAAVAALQDRDRLVVSITEPRRGGGPDGANAYRQLNLQREFFVESRVRLILWVTESEAVELARHAPDFWVFRQRVVEFTRERVARRGRTVKERIPLYDWTSFLRSDALVRTASCERLLADLPAERQTLGMRADLLYELAGLRWANGEMPASLEHLEQGLRLVDGLEELDFRARCLTALGIVYTDLERLEEALASHQAAVALRPSSPEWWMNMIETYRRLARRREGVAAFKKVVRLAPADPRPWNNVGNVYADLGRYEQAAEAYREAISLDPAQAVPRLNLVHLYLEEERSRDASRILEGALALLADHPEMLDGLQARYASFFERILDGDGLRVVR